MIFLILIFLFLIFYLLALRCRKNNLAWRKLDKFAYAHRGYHHKPQIPENSLPAFQRAIDRGWGAELDVHLLRDGTLAVFHDSDLRRCTGKEGILEKLDYASLRELRLEGTEERIPVLDEVLALFEEETPLIIELKTYRDNAAALAEAVCRRLDSYKGAFCLESFDPRALQAVKKLRPRFCRGQLSMNFANDHAGQPPHIRFLLTNLLLNFRTVPDFIAYRYYDRKNLSFRLATRLWGAKAVYWTIQNKDAYDDIVCRGGIPIFEKFDPEQ